MRQTTDPQTTTRKVLYSPGFGAGWMTWADPEHRQDFLFDSELIAAVEAGEDVGYEDDPDSPLGKFKARLIAKHGPDAEHAYFGGARDLAVAEVDGPFRIDEYDGSESIVLADKEEWF